jgi:hypothetical protein
MTKRGHFFIIEFILLNMGLLGYISGNTPLAYIGLLGALPFFIRELRSYPRKIARIRPNGCK